MQNNLNSHNVGRNEKKEIIRIFFWYAEKKYRNKLRILLKAKKYLLY